MRMGENWMLQGSEKHSTQNSEGENREQSQEERKRDE
jgi:hypothetical protein